MGRIAVNMGVDGLIVGLHTLNITINVVIYLVLKPLLLQEGDPEPNKGLLAKLPPHYEPPINLATVQEYLRLSAVPSFFYILHHLIFCGVGASSQVTGAFTLV